MSFHVKQLKPVVMWKAQVAIRIVLTSFSILVVSPILACVPQIPVTGPGTPAGVASPATPILETNGVALAPTTSPIPSPAVAQGPSLTFYADADARVKESDPDRNYGDSRRLHVDGGNGPHVESFLHFTVTGVTGIIQSAKLRLYAVNDSTLDGPAVYATDDSWTETELTWNNRPNRLGEALDNKGWIPTNSWVEYDVTSLVKDNGAFNFALIPDDSTDGIDFSSRQGIQAPQLVITLSNDAALSPTPILTLSPAPTPSSTGESAVLVGAGDIADCDNQNAQLTAQLVEAIPGTVFTLGDNAYPAGTSAEFMNCYDTTWGKFKDRTKPVPGNHDYMTVDASAYFQYFNNVPSYYAYDLGSWRIYALNSEIDVSAASPQVVWLLADLAANPRQCVLAYWHQPRWSSGIYHGSSSIYQTLWQILYTAGAEVVLNGHEHNYERFTPMNPDGQPDPQGLREFVVGTGGGEQHYSLGDILPTSEVQDDTSFGVLKLTLHPDGYGWQFIPVAGATFTDSGSTQCH